MVPSRPVPLKHTRSCGGPRVRIHLPPAASLVAISSRGREGCSARVPGYPLQSRYFGIGEIADPTSPSCSGSTDEDHPLSEAEIQSHAIVEPYGATGRYVMFSSIERK